MSYVKYVCDTETTGTDPDKNDIIEICFWRIGDEESKTWCMSPLAPDNIEDEALRVNKHVKEEVLGLTPEGKEKYRHPSEVLPEIEMWLMEDGAAAEERVFIGQNPMFDYNFLLALYRIFRINSLGCACCPSPNLWGGVQIFYARTNILEMPFPL